MVLSTASLNKKWSKFEFISELGGPHFFQVLFLSQTCAATHMWQLRAQNVPRYGKKLFCGVVFHHDLVRNGFVAHRPNRRSSSCAWWPLAVWPIMCARMSCNCFVAHRPNRRSSSCARSPVPVWPIIIQNHNPESRIQNHNPESRISIQNHDSESRIIIQSQNPESRIRIQNPASESRTKFQNLDSRILNPES